MTATQEKWQRHVTAWQASGLSKKAYAAAHGLQPGTLEWWRRRLRGGLAGAAAASVITLQRRGTLVDGHLVAADGQVTIDFPTLGARLRCGAATDAASLQQALVALSSLARSA